ncbi:hypothetical protein PM082_011350 [Marasmius tenuissimus]|nr:hypothetical protein PM082_011350 [Marasmius tenuissimus]
MCRSYTCASLSHTAPKSTALSVALALYLPFFPLGCDCDSSSPLIIRFPCSGTEDGYMARSTREWRMNVQRRSSECTRVKPKRKLLSACYLPPLSPSIPSSSLAIETPPNNNKNTCYTSLPATQANPRPQTAHPSFAYLSSLAPL